MAAVLVAMPFFLQWTAMQCSGRCGGGSEALETGTSSHFVLHCAISAMRAAAVGRLKHPAVFGVYACYVWMCVKLGGPSGLCTVNESRLEFDERGISLDHL